MDDELIDPDSAGERQARERQVRFGELPARIHPDTAVGTVQTSVPQGRPDAAVSEDQYRALLAGG